MKSKCFLDSNFLIYFLDRKSIFHQKAKEIVAGLNADNYTLVISPLVIDEFVYSLKKLLIFEGITGGKIFSELLRAYDAIFKLPNLEIVPINNERSENRKVIGYMEEYNLKPRDAYHLLVMKKNRIREFATFDKDFRRVFAKNILKKAE